MEKSYEAPKLLVGEGEISESIAAGIASAITGSATSSATSSTSSCGSAVARYSLLTELTSDRTIVRTEHLIGQEVVDKTLGKTLLPLLQREEKSS